MKKLDKALLMDYIYDELEPAQRSEVEAYLAEHPEAQQELDELQGVRTTLQALPDREVQRPIIMVGEPEPKGRQVVLAGWWKGVAAVAAAVILLMTVGAITRMQVQVGDGGFSVAFNAAPTSVEQPQLAQLTSNNYSRNDLERMLDSAMQRQLESRDDSLLEALTDWRSDLVAQVQKNSTPVRQVSNESMSEDQMRALLGEMNQENMRLLMVMMQNSSQEMQQNMQQTLYDFAQFYDLQRSEDMSQIGLKLANLEQNTEAAQQQADYIYNVLTSNPK